MARPKPKILLTVELNDESTWDITHSDHQYVITYKDQPCGVRQHIHTLTTNGFKYQKLSYTNHGNALAQARRLNNKFNTEDFAVKTI